VSFSKTHLKAIESANIFELNHERLYNFLRRPEPEKGGNVEESNPEV
jgi:hypothetical protein